MQENDDECPIYNKISSDTWRTGHITELQMDVVSLNYAVECKHRKSIPKWLIGAWKQIIDISIKHDKYPLLVLKKNYMPLMHVITPERHAELLLCEKKLKE